MTAYFRDGVSMGQIDTEGRKGRGRKGSIILSVGCGCIAVLGAMLQRTEFGRVVVKVGEEREPAADEGRDPAIAETAGDCRPACALDKFQSRR